MVTLLLLPSFASILISDLRAENIPNLQVFQRSFICNSAELANTTEKIITIIIESSSAVALSLFSSWLYNRFKMKKPDNATINDTDIVNNIENINITVNNYIQIIQNDESNKKK